MVPRSAPGAILLCAFLALVVLAVARLVLPAHQMARAATVFAAGAQARAAACDDAGFLRIAAARPAGYTEVTVCGPVTRVLRRRTSRSGTHAYFFVRVDDAGDAIEVVTNVDETGSFAVRPGQYATVRGRYYYDNSGSQGIDWTHRSDPGASWPYSGYVQLDGGPLID